MTDHSISRRGFLAAAGLAAGSSATAAATGDGETIDRRSSEPSAKWYKNAYRRAVIDMHISDWDDRFLSQFDPRQYVQMLLKSRAQSIVCYCQSHTGLFNFPTQVGRQHRGLRGRNILKEMINGCDDHGISVQLYTSLIYDRWAGDQHPQWRMRTWDGKIQGEGDRHAVLCPNSPYRDYVRRFVEEICRQFDFEGIRFDMTFWPSVCYCQYCRQRFEDEVGGELPVTVDWLDPRWVAFQRCRERWLVEFAALATGIVRRLKPNASVEHQASTFPLDWVFGVTAPLARQNDFLQGDFYGDALQGSFVRKLLETLTPNRPFGYETSFSVSLSNHTARKSQALLHAKASAAVADHAAFVFIDAIDPVGTVNLRVHERMGRVFDRLEPYYEHLGGDRLQDIGVFFSPESKFDFSTNGRHIRSHDRTNAHTESCMHVARRLLEHHVPWGVVTKETLGQLRDLRVLVLSNVNMMDEEEVAAIRRWVKRGGVLYASGGTSLVDKSGRMHDDFMLADVFGVSLEQADWQGRKHYLAPTSAGQKFFRDYDAKYPVFTTGYGMQVKATPNATVLATTTLPWQAPEPSQFASIHSDPPWVATDLPELTVHEFGRGKAIYAATLLETIDELGGTFVSLLRTFAGPFRFEVDAPASVEATVFHQKDRKRYVVALADFQAQLPNIPIEGIKVRLQLGHRVKRIVQLATDRPISFSNQGDTIRFTAPRLETLAMFAVEIE